MFLAFLILAVRVEQPLGRRERRPWYMIPTLPFLVVPLTYGFARLSPRIRSALAGLGCVSMGLALVTLDLVPSGGSLIASHLQNIDDFGLSPTVFTMAVGPAGWIVHLALIGGAVSGTSGQWGADERQ